MDLNAKLAEVARHFEGQRETGYNKGPAIELVQSILGKVEGESYCMCGVQYCIAVVESENHVTSLIYKSEGCVEVWDRTPRSLRVTEPRPGDVIIWQHKDTGGGHTGIVLESRGDAVTTLEFNTDGSGGREGDGVYIRSRSKTGNGTLVVLGFLRPFP